LLHVGEHELHPLARTEPGELAAEPAARSGDHRHLPGEVLHVRPITTFARTVVCCRAAEAPMDFTYSQRTKDLQARVTAFMERYVYPGEKRFAAEVDEHRRKGNPWQPTRV